LRGTTRASRLDHLRIESNNRLFSDGSGITVHAGALPDAGVVVNKPVSDPGI
jgi:hypothetical protein